VGGGGGVLGGGEGGWKDGRGKKGGESEIGGVAKGRGGEYGMVEW